MYGELLVGKRFVVSKAYIHESPVCIRKLRSLVPTPPSGVYCALMRATLLTNLIAQRPSLRAVTN